MDTRACLSILLLLFGVSQASPLMDERFEGVFVSEPEPLDITTRILESNNGSSEVLIEGDVVFPKTRNALYCLNNNCFWKKNANNIVEIPYIVSSEFSYYDKSVIANAMSTFHSKTCIRFVARSTQADYISIENKDGCYSSLGRTGGKQVVSFNRQGCVYHGIVQHELNHALGFYHEQTRSDRDKYVKINWENISPDMAYNFQKQNTNNQNTPYDYGSIMHYGKTAFSIQAGLETITPIPDETVEIGQRQGMSNTDILRINKLRFLSAFISVSFMNNQKQQKPTLTGQRFKTRKRDEKERFDPSQFQESIVQGLNQTGTDLEAVAKFLDASGAKLDYRRYAETLFDILVAGGMLAPGGTLSDDMTRTEYCLFTASEDLETMQAYAQVFNKLIRRYKYLEKGFEEEIKKLLLFLKGFTESERNKLAMLTGILLANGNISASILNSLFNENLVKEGVSAAFAVKLFKSWINEKDINSVSASLRKVGMDNRLMELFPANKRSCEHFSKYFTDAGLKELSDFARNQQSIGARKELQKELQEQMSRGETLKDIIAYVREEMKKTSISEQTMIGIVWTSVMSTVEWNKKEELVTEQAIKHLKQYSPLLKAFTSQGLSELTLLLKIQEYCYDNIHFMKAFQKIVVLLYKADVLSEEVILKWYTEAHMAKGKSVFLEQMKKFVEWLKNAEEESESEEEEGD
ncbi:hypothetical protein QQF64_019278 [Cirrhinus molitorella]|uniref:Metalloendopeptidase n=1 Tax=Cirrhinus molitorella TaxID=172907 RepID=A0ABR3LF08_9TELE